MMKRAFIASLGALAVFVIAGQQVLASGETGDTSGGEHGLNPIVLVGLAAMLVIAKLGGEMFERFNQPAVLGELVGGMAVGALVLAGVTGVEQLRANEVIGAIAE